MRVCMIAYTFYENDGRVMRYAETLVKRGDHVDVIALRWKGKSSYETINGVNVYKIQQRSLDEKGKFSYLFKLLLFFVRSSFFVTCQHFKRHYDLIHVHSVPDFEVFATLIPKLWGAKIILDIHDIVPEFYASKFRTEKNSFVFRLLLFIERISGSYADHVIIANHIWQKTLVNRSVSKDKCTVILNYPDESIFYKRTCPKNEGKFILMYPGTVNWHQGLDIAIKALALIKDQCKNVELHIYGSGQNSDSLLHLIEELDLQERVILNGFLPISQIAQIMASADIGIVPKRNDPFGGEAFSTKIFEFMSLGVPVIVSKTKIDDYYFNDSLVQFFKPEDEIDLARCIRLLVNNKELRDKLIENSNIFIRDYSWDVKKNEYLKIVDELTCPPC